MDMKQTLFSLELAVDSLRIVPYTVICRLPAVAVRLLDFPPLMIQQLDSDETKQLRHAVYNMWGDDNRVPNQLEELKNRHGNYEFKRGKSSLYNYELDLLESHLASTPLYIMVVDSWNEEVPKLIGHCNISLKDVISSIKHDVSEFGISVPSVHGTQGQFPVFNLMGSEIGWILLGIRLLSLGGNLIPHIPEASIARKGECMRPIDAQQNFVPKRIPVHKGEVTTVRKKSPEVEDSALVQEDHTKLGADAIKPAHCMKNSSTQISETDFVPQDKTTREKGSLSSPTTHRVSAKSKTNIQSRQRHAEPHKPLHIADDMYVSNVHVPPPLVFNSQNENQEEQQRSLHAVDRSPYVGLVKDSHPKDNVTHDHTQGYLRSSFTEERRELEVQYTIHPPEFHSSPNVRKILRKKREQFGSQSKVPSECDDDIHVHVAENKENIQTNLTSGEGSGTVEFEHLHRLPILNALLQELNLLHGANVYNRRLNFIPDHQYHQRPTSKRNEKEQEVEKSQKKQQERDAVAEPELPVARKPPREKVYRYKHKECVQPHAGVPSSKGWLRQEPTYHRKSRGSHSGKKAKQLKFKMTTSQKLRLQRHNPEALRLLEEEERIAEIQFQMRAAQMQEDKFKCSPRGKSIVSGKGRSPPAAPHPSDSTVSGKGKSPPAAPHPSDDLVLLPNTTVSTEISRHPEQGDHEDGGLSPSDADDRLKRGADTVKIVEYDSAYIDQDHASEQAHKVHHPGSPDERREESGSLSHQGSSEKDVSGSEKSIRSISVRLPSALAQSESDADDRAEESSSGDESHDEGPKIIPVPGFPTDENRDKETGAEAACHPVPSSRTVYSDDFEGSYNLQSTGEQELAIIHSPGESAQFSTGLSMEAIHERSSVEPQDYNGSGLSDKSSYETVESMRSVGSARAESGDGASAEQSAASKHPSSSSSSAPSSKHPTARLTIPQPQISANSPIPLTRRSATKSAVVRRDSNLQPPQPKPRLSLDRTASSISNASLLAPDLTLSKDGSFPDDVYSDDFDSGEN